MLNEPLAGVTDRRMRMAAVAFLLGLLAFTAMTLAFGGDAAQANCLTFDTVDGVDAYCPEPSWYDEVPIVEQIKFAWQFYFG